MRLPTNKLETVNSIHRTVADYSAPGAIAYVAVPALQKKSPEEELQMKSVTQLANPEEEEFQMKSVGQLKSNTADGISQRKEHTSSPRPNHTGMPDRLKTGIENLSGFSMDDVKVHYNSGKPAQLNALAYAQGTDIHIAQGQEQHLPHEAWHVVQQKQGRVRPTMQMKEVTINDDRGLEKEADVMGGKAVTNKFVAEFAYNRSRLITQRKPQEMDNNDPEAMQSRTFQRRTTNNNQLSIQDATIGHFLDYSLPSHQNIIQRKKTARPTNEDLIDLIGKGVEDKIVNGKTTDSEKGDAVWEKLNSEYDICKNNGDGYWTALEEKVVEYNDIGRRAGLVDRLDTNRAVNAARYDQNYSSTIERLPKGDTKYRVNSKGYDPDVKSRPLVKTGKDEGHYSNKFDLTSGVIKAAWNFADDDKARKANKGINNSEILYRQFNDVAKEHYKLDSDQDARVKNAIKGISKIIRSTIINKTTRAVMYMAYPDNEKPSDGKKTWATNTGEFKALLGTPNAKSTPFLLMDHLDEMGKTIDNIETEYNNLDVNLRNI